MIEYNYAMGCSLGRERGENTVAKLLPRISHVWLRRSLCGLCTRPKTSSRQHVSTIDQVSVFLFPLLFPSQAFHYFCTASNERLSGGWVKLGTDGSTIKLAQERKSLAAIRRPPYMVRQHDLVLTISFSLGSFLGMQ